MLYFDSASTSLMYPEVIDKIQDTMKHTWGNPANLYQAGLEANAAVETARMQIAKAINACPREIIFTSCSSESNALALAQRKHCMASEYEHHDILANPKTEVFPENFIESLGVLHKESGYELAIWKEYIYTHMLVNNETGEIFDLKQKIEAAHNLGMLVLVDATQALGNIPIDVKEINADFMSFSFHKVHGPKGIGALYVKEDLVPKLIPVIYGSQEFHKRGGTSNVPYIVGSGLAVSKAVAEMEDKNKWAALMRGKVLTALEKNRIPFVVNSGVQNIPSILNIGFAGITGESMMLALDRDGIFVSTGSACNTGNHEPSRVLKAMRVPSKYINGAIRISFCLDNTVEDVNFLIEKIIDNYKKLSPQ